MGAMNRFPDGFSMHGLATFVDALLL